MDIDPRDWVWYGLPGHFMGADDCRFRLCTKVGKCLVSSVGEYYPQGSRDKADGPCEIGLHRLYETMVFGAGVECADVTCGCEMPEIIPNALEMVPSHTRGEAMKAHMDMCFEYARWEKK